MGKTRLSITGETIDLLCVSVDSYEDLQIGDLVRFGGWKDPEAADQEGTGIITGVWKDFQPRGVGPGEWYYAEVLWNDGKMYTFEVGLLEKVPCEEKKVLKS